MRVPDLDGARVRLILKEGFSIRLQDHGFPNPDMGIDELRRIGS
jgi:hypothetical protein